MSADRFMIATDASGQQLLLVDGVPLTGTAERDHASLHDFAIELALLLGQTGLTTQMGHGSAEYALAPELRTEAPQLFALAEFQTI